MRLLLTRAEVALAKLAIERDLKHHAAGWNETERQPHRELYAKLAAYIVEDAANPPFSIEAQRDEFASLSDEERAFRSIDAEETHYVPCGDEEAEIFAVFSRVPGDAEGGSPDDFDWVQDFKTRAEAEAFIAEQR